jgi:hypothetical protein
VSTPPREPTEQELEEMRAAYEAELSRITAADVAIQTAVTLINLAGRRLGFVEGVEGERDLEQVRDAIDAVRGLMPVLERRAPEDIAQLKAALAQLQMAYASEANAASGPASDAPVASPPAAGPLAPAAAATAPPAPAAPSAPGDDETPGPAQSSGRLWIPGR